MLKQVKGTKDIIANDYYKMQSIYDTVYKIASSYGFIPISTPIFEYSEVFTKTLGDDSDIITKEMYTFVDKGENSITLRPEFTAAIVRSFITNSLSQISLPLKLICHGPLFRYERPQKGRLRQFHQINCEILGEDDYSADVEAISLAVNILKALGIYDKVTLELNSLGDEESYGNYRQALVNYLSSYKNTLSLESQARLNNNPLRILDSKDQGDKNILQDAPKIYDYYNSSSQQLFIKIKESLEKIGITYIVNPHLVRGLDYYCHTTFEFTTTALGAQSAIIAGGRYDKLIEKMGGTSTPAIGFAGGVERISTLMDIKPAKQDNIISIITIDEHAKDFSMQVAHILRNKNLSVRLMIKGNLNKRMKKSTGCLAVILIGSKEMEKGIVTIKNMKTGIQKEVQQNNIISTIKEIFDSD